MAKKKSAFVCVFSFLCCLPLRETEMKSHPRNLNLKQVAEGIFEEAELGEGEDNENSSRTATHRNTSKDSDALRVQSHASHNNPSFASSHEGVSASFKTTDGILIKQLMNALDGVVDNIHLQWSKTGVVALYVSNSFLVRLVLEGDQLHEYEHNGEPNEVIESAVATKSMTIQTRCFQKDDVVTVAVRKNENMLELERSYYQGTHKSLFYVPLLSCDSTPNQVIPASQFKIVANIQCQELKKLIDNMKDIVDQVRFSLLANDGEIALQLTGLSDDSTLCRNPQRHIITVAKKDKSHKNDLPPGIQCFSMLPQTDVDFELAELTPIQLDSPEGRAQIKALLPKGSDSVTVCYKSLQYAFKASTLCASVDMYLSEKYVVFCFSIGTLGFIRYSLPCLADTDADDEVERYRPKTGAGDPDGLAETTDFGMFETFINAQAAATQDAGATQQAPVPKPTPLKTRDTGKEKDKEKEKDPPIRTRQFKTPVPIAPDADDFEDGNFATPVKRPNQATAQKSAAPPLLNQLLSSTSSKAHPAAHQAAKPNSKPKPKPKPPTSTTSVLKPVCLPRTPITTPTPPEITVAPKRAQPTPPPAPQKSLSNWAATASARNKPTPAFKRNIRKEDEMEEDEEEEEGDPDERAKNDDDDDFEVPVLKPPTKRKKWLQDEEEEEDEEEEKVFDDDDCLPKVAGSGLNKPAKRAKPTPLFSDDDEDVSLADSNESDGYNDSNSN